MTTTGWTGVAIAATVLSVGGCVAGDRGGSASVVSVDTVGGVVHVRNAGEAPRWSLREVATISTPDGPASFGQVRALLADSAGNVYIADSKASEIRVFDESGVHLRTMGRQGAGPSEFGSLYSIGWAGDTLAVLDPGNARVGLMSPDGDWLGQVRHDRITGPQLHMYTVDRAVHWMGLKRGADGKLERFFLRYSADRTDTLAYPPSNMPPTATIICPHPEGGGFSFFSNPYAVVAQPVPAPGRQVAVVTGDGYRIAVLSVTGDTTRIIEKARAAVPISDAEWEEATREHREWTARAPGVKCNPVEFTRPAAKPAIRDIFHDDAGRMWVEAVSPDGFELDVYDQDGRQVGAIASPGRDGSVRPYVRDDMLYLAAADSLDVQSVRLFRIQR